MWQHGFVASFCVKEGSVLAWVHPCSLGGSGAQWQDRGVQLHQWGHVQVQQYLVDDGHNCWFKQSFGYKEFGYGYTQQIN
jgi:hypothetical protein